CSSDLDGQVAGGAETGPEARHFIDGEWHDVAFRYFDAQPAQSHPWPAQTHRPALQERLMKTAGDLARSLGELVVHGAIGDGHTRKSTRLNSSHQIISY